MGDRRLHKCFAMFCRLREEPIGSLLFTCNGRGKASRGARGVFSVHECTFEGLYGRQHVDARALEEALGEELGQSSPQRTAGQAWT